METAIRDKRSGTKHCAGGFSTMGNPNIDIGRRSECEMWGLPRRRTDLVNLDGKFDGNNSLLPTDIGAENGHIEVSSEAAE